MAQKKKTGNTKFLVLSVRGHKFESFLVVADFVISLERHARAFGWEKLNTIVTTSYSVALFAKHYCPLSAIMAPPLTREQDDAETLIFI